MRRGQRVEMTANDTLKGERGTVTDFPETNVFEDDGAVWVSFDNNGQRFGRERGFLVIEPQWVDKRDLRKMR